jgi:nucleoside-diphosphate-sugar epimerase
MHPTALTTEAELDDRLSDPPAEVVESLARLDGDLIILGAGGKMGPSLAVMAQRASDLAGSRRRVIAVSRFSGGSDQPLRDRGITTVACDLSDERAVSGLPDAPLIVFMAGRKFGSTGDEATTWAMNTYLPALVCRRYGQCRIVVFSTGNVYGLVPVGGGGSREADTPRPSGEYAMSCLGRERVCEYFSRRSGTPVALFRLNYACDLRYGVLVDLAHQILRGEPVDLAMGYFNTIWQGDANAMALRALEHASSPPWVVNATGPETLSVRSVAERLARRLGRTVGFTGTESDTALLSDARLGIERLGPLRVSAEALVEWVADWVDHGGKVLGKPTHFESRDGSF